MFKFKIHHNEGNLKLTARCKAEKFYCYKDTFRTDSEIEIQDSKIQQYGKCQTQILQEKKIHNIFYDDV